jgi:hypothetical protein
VRLLVAALVLAGCANPEQQPPRGPTSPPLGPVSVVEPDALVELDAVPAAVVPPAAEVWLKGSTHVHAKPSGDSVTPIPEVIAYYEQRGYDFIALTDHNRISEVGQASTEGSPAVRHPASGLIVLAGIELTYNPTGCIPAGDESGRCRIHVNLLGPTKRFDGKLEWANRKSDERVEKYQAAIDAGKQLGGVIQLNHPTWYWGMTADVMAEVARRGIPLVEIANVQFEQWNAGDKDHPSTEALWDAVLARGHTMWGVASDDAHAYNGPGKYPAGGAWIVVRARRDPQAILDALARGRFYASTGVTLTRAGVEGEELVVEVDGADHTIDFVENGKLVARVNGKLGRRAVPASGYVRAVVTSSDGKKAWVQPARK